MAVDKFAVQVRSPKRSLAENDFCPPAGDGAVFSSGMDRPDQLRELFRMQKSLNERIGVVTDGMTEEDKTKWVLNYCRAMSQEIAELTDSVPWKWWAKYQKFDEQNAKVEVVDLFHFLISLAQVLGMSAEDVFQAYVKKNEVNFKRQETGYAVKDEHDSRHI
jgi:dimeric dUTPase (all-alpha-NTP-PPase superfamily)